MQNHSSVTAVRSRRLRYYDDGIGKLHKVIVVAVMLMHVELQKAILMLDGLQRKDVLPERAQVMCEKHVLIHQTLNSSSYTINLGCHVCFGFYAGRGDECKQGKKGYAIVR